MKFRCKLQQEVDTGGPCRVGDFQKVVTLLITSFHILLCSRKHESIKHSAGNGIQTGVSQELCGKVTLKHCRHCIHTQAGFEYIERAKAGVGLSLRAPSRLPSYFPLRKHHLEASPHAKKLPEVSAPRRRARREAGASARGCLAAGRAVAYLHQESMMPDGHQQQLIRLITKDLSTSACRSSRAASETASPPSAPFRYLNECYLERISTS